MCVSRHFWRGSSILCACNCACVSCSFSVAIFRVGVQAALRAAPAKLLDVGLCFAFVCFSVRASRNVCLEHRQHAYKDKRRCMRGMTRSIKVRERPCKKATTPCANAPTWRNVGRPAHAAADILVVDALGANAGHPHAAFDVLIAGRPSQQPGLCV